MRVVPSYRPGASPLHASRASVGIAFCGSFALASMLYDNPLVLGGALLGVIAAAAGAGVVAELRRAAWFAVPLAVLIVAVNALVARGGETVVFRGGEILGRRLDVTLEAIQYGGMNALRILVLVAAFALYSATVDPDDVLRLLRRFSYRSALTVSLATRLVPVLQRDSQRISEAACCRAEHPPRGTGHGRHHHEGPRPGGGRGGVARGARIRGCAPAGAAAPAVVAPRPAGRGPPLSHLPPWPSPGSSPGWAGWTHTRPSRSRPGAGELALAAAFLAGGMAPFAGARARLGVARA